MLEQVQILMHESYPHVNRLPFSKFKLNLGND